MKLRNKKTGEIKTSQEVICEALEKYEIISFNALFEEWEDYEPKELKEPLIKDEKIRKAVRVWADGNNIESVHYDAFWRGFRRKNSSITVWEELPLEDNEVYTIAELCGDSEEEE